MTGRSVALSTVKTVVEKKCHKLGNYHERTTTTFIMTREVFVGEVILGGSADWHEGAQWIVCDSHPTEISHRQYTLEVLVTCNRFLATFLRKTKVVVSVDSQTVHEHCAFSSATSSARLNFLRATNSSTQPRLFVSRNNPIRNWYEILVVPTLYSRVSTTANHHTNSAVAGCW